MSYDIAIIGTADVILGFKALGLKTFPVTGPEEVTPLLQKLVNETVAEAGAPEDTRPQYAVIFIIEDLAQTIPLDQYKKLSSKALPAIIPLPGPKGSTGFGEKRLKRLIVQAVGTEI